MLLPCGISLFSGVEFVCCPRHSFKDTLKTPTLGKDSLDNIPADDLGLNSNDEGDDDDDETDDNINNDNNKNDK